MVYILSVSNRSSVLNRISKCPLFCAKSTAPTGGYGALLMWSNIIISLMSFASAHARTALRFFSSAISGSAGFIPSN